MVSLEKILSSVSSAIMGSLVRPFLQHFPHQETGNQRTSVEEINLQEVYGFFTSNEVAQQFVIIIIGQVSFLHFLFDLTKFGLFIKMIIFSLFL